MVLLLEKEYVEWSQLGRAHLSQYKTIPWLHWNGRGNSLRLPYVAFADDYHRRLKEQTQESGYPINPPNPWRMGDSTINDHLDRKKQGPPSIHRAHPLPSPSTLHGHYDSCEGSLPLEHPPHTADLSDKGAPPFKKQDQPPPIDDKVSETPLVPEPFAILNIS